MNPIVKKVLKTAGSLVVTVGFPAVAEFFTKRSIDAQIEKRAAEVAAETVKNLLKNTK